MSSPHASTAPLSSSLDRGENAEVGNARQRWVLCRGAEVRIQGSECVSERKTLMLRETVGVRVNATRRYLERKSLWLHPRRLELSWVYEGNDCNEGQITANCNVQDIYSV